MNNNPELSVIIVNYNAKEFLRRCLISISRQIEDINFEIWVVDNASCDGSQEMLRKEFPMVKLIVNEKNVGFAKANNQAIRLAKGNTIFLLNPDTELLDKNLKRMVDFLKENTKIGIAGPLIVNKDHSIQRQCKRGIPNFWNSFCYFSGLWKIFNKSERQRKLFGGYFLLDKPDDQIVEVDSVSGAAMLIKKEVFNRIGLLEEKYVMYADDIDICLRTKEAGYSVYYVPLMKVLHYGGKGGAEAQLLENLWYFHRSACQLYQRFIAPYSFFVINWLFYIGTCLIFLVKLFLNVLFKKKIIGSKKF